MAELKDLMSQVVLPITVADLKERLETGRVSTVEGYISSYCQRSSNTENETINSADHHRSHQSSKNCRGFNKRRDHHRSKSCNSNNIANINLDHHQNIIIKSKAQCPDCCKVFFHEVRLPENLINTKSVPFSNNNVAAKDAHYHKSPSKYSNFKSPDNVPAMKVFEKNNFPKHIEKTSMPNITNPSGAEGFVCCVCDRVFSVQGNYVNHLKTHMEGERHKCTQCNKIFADKSCFAKHLLDHKTKGFTCLKCKKSFPDKWKYTRHLQTHLAHKCTLCEKRFVKKSSLISHMVSHAKNQQLAIMPTRNECNICKKVFAEESNLIEHMKSHAPENMQIVPYNNTTTISVSSTMQSNKFLFRENRHLCTICGKSYKDKWKLKQHIIIHTGEKSHACNICDKKFYYKWRLTTHIKRCHTVKQEKVVIVPNDNDIKPEEPTC